MPLYFDSCNQLPHGHIILVYDVWLFNIHSLFFMMTILAVYQQKVGITFMTFQRTAVVFKDRSVTTTDDPHFSLFIFYHILQWNIFHLAYSHCSCCSNSHCTQVHKQSWAFKIIVHDKVITGGLHHRKFAD